MLVDKALHVLLVQLVLLLSNECINDENYFDSEVVSIHDQLRSKTADIIIIY